MLKFIITNERLCLTLFCTSGVLYSIAAVKFFHGRLNGHKLVSIPLGLRLFLRSMLVLSLILPLSSILTSVYCLLGFDIAAPPGLCLRLIMLAGSQIIDFSALIVSIDCVVASVTQNRKPLLQEQIHGVFAVTICVVISCATSCVFNFAPFDFVLPLFLFTTTTHSVCFLTELIMLFINLRRHKIVPLTYQLSIRHNLVRNIKLLQLFCPYLFLVTVTSACGPIVFLYARYYMPTTRPVYISLFYIFYNIGLLANIIIFMRKYHKQTFKPRVAFINSDQERNVNHFQQLNVMWR